MSRRLIFAAVVLAAAVSTAVVSFLRTPATHDGPNVLFIVWDTVRADRMSLYGYDKPTTPKLERRAESALVFDQVVSPAIWTPPSHSSMFTGYAPSRHGVTATYKWLDNHHVTLAEWLGLHGYGTYAFSANPYVAADTNITQGFDLVEHTFEGRWKRAARRATKDKLIEEDASTDISPRWKPQPGQRASGKVHPFKDGGPVSQEALLTWLDEREDPDAPWFAFINMMEAHIPRIPSMKARKKLMSDERILTSLQTDVAQINLLSYTFNKKEFTDEELAAINGVYDATLIDLDDVTDDLLNALEARGELDDTIVVLTSDHGENLGDHHMFGHKYGIFETLTHVPLVIWWPDHVEPGRVTEPVSNLHLFTTLLELVGLDPPDTAPDAEHDLTTFEGGEPSFIQLVEATPVAIRRIDKLYGVDDKKKYMRTFDGVRMGPDKLVRDSEGGLELYDIDEDPGETNDLAAERPDRVAELVGLLDAWLAEVPPYDPALRTDEDKKPPVKPRAKELLEQLGYLEADDTDAE